MKRKPDFLLILMAIFGMGVLVTLLLPMANNTVAEISVLHEPWVVTAARVPAVSVQPLATVQGGIGRDKIQRNIPRLAGDAIHLLVGVRQPHP